MKRVAWTVTDAIIDFVVGVLADINVLSLGDRKKGEDPDDADFFNRKLKRPDPAR